MRELTRGEKAFEANEQERKTRTVAVVATELQNAMDAASRVPRLRAELDALLGKKARKAVAK